MGSLDTLMQHALAIVRAELTRQVPAKAHCPQLERKTLPQLGSPTVKVEELDSRGDDNTASLKAAAAEERARREAEGIGDRVQNRQPIQPPTFDSSLVGRHLEVRWKVGCVLLMRRVRLQGRCHLSGGRLRCCVSVMCLFRN